MKNFDITQLADYVRGVAAPEVDQRIRDGIGSTSTRSRKEVELLTRVAEVGRWDRDHEVPGSAVRIAQAIGSLRPPKGAASRHRRLPYKILFDSLLQPALAGTRSGAASARHLVAESEDFTVDARLEFGHRETSAPGRGAFVAAQILRREGGQPVPETPVLVFSGDEIVGSGLTQATGDFQATGLPDGPLSLCLLIGDEACLELPL